MSNIPEVPAATIGEQARNVALQVRALVESIDGFGFLPSAELRRLNVPASVPDAFLEIGARAMESRPILGAAAKAKPDTLRTAVVDTDGILALAAELNRLARGCQHTVKRIRGNAGTEALRVYQVSQSLVRPRDLEDDATWVQQMKLALDRPGRTKKSVEARRAKKKAQAAMAAAAA